MSKFTIEELERWAFTDGLTGVPNRRKLGMDLEERRAAGIACCYVAIDLDDFGSAQKMLGRDRLWGDRCLANFGEFLLDHTRQVDAYPEDQAGPRKHPDLVLGRMGGDEFLIVVDSLCGAERVADKIRVWSFDGVTATVGVGLTEGNAEQDLRRVKALHKAKRLAVPA